MAGRGAGLRQTNVNITPSASSVTVTINTLYYRAKYNVWLLLSYQTEYVYVYGACSDLESYDRYPQCDFTVGIVFTHAIGSSASI